MAVELRWADDPDAGVTSDWGPIPHTAPRPDRGEVGELMVTTPAYFDELITFGSKRHVGAFHTAWREGDRLFMGVEYEGQSWKWELFDAKWQGDEKLLLIGRHTTREHV